MNKTQQEKYGSAAETFGGMNQTKITELDRFGAGGGLLFILK